MISEWGEELASGALLVGVTLILVVLYLHTQSRRLRKLILKLYDVNKVVRQDALDFVDQAWPILNAAGFRGMTGQIIWFGEIKTIEKGADAQVAYPVSIAEGGMDFQLSLSAPRLRGEKKFFAQLIFQTFKSLLVLDVSNKNTQFFLSQKRLEKYQLLVQHDIKNLAQFIQLLADQVREASSEDEKNSLVNHLKKVLPVVTERAEKTIKQMTISSGSFQSVEPIEFASEIARIAQGIGIEYQLKGLFSCSMSYALFEQVIKNVLENFQSHGDGSPVLIEVMGDGQVVFSMTHQKTREAIQSERLFEPFWSSSEEGMGLGLFIARELLSTMGGAIYFEALEGKNRFVVQFCSHVVLA
ncbi:ATP-binding protein [Hydrogenovibrio sp. 3SP14C1]|uniref:sensor histidine kinase n=1 Tax=Hydrogenovibrio sp. 3SP14C1 TaxID=3038774 RepID=UPI002416EF97|nr:ATP-binding protein [Hydrogenovibrio sp. 3SP14C1]MDG4811706.1 ATP-binding protein [Hydrogenovibrio sp. 3SP14C1]